MNDEPERLRPRPAPHSADPAADVPSPRPRHSPAVAGVESVGEPELVETTSAPRSGRRLPRVLSGRGVFAGRSGRVTAIACVMAGVAVFAVARATEPTDARAQRPGSATASAPANDVRALLTDPSAAQAYIAAASSEVVIVSESDYRNLDAALESGLSVTTGAFQTRFRDALTGANAQARRANHGSTNIDVLQVGIGQVSSDGNQAKVLIFARLRQTGDDVDTGSANTLVTLTPTLVRKGDQFLISDLEQGVNAGVPPGTTGLRAAAEAARSEVVNTLTYSRADFAADLARVQQGATAALGKQLSGNAAALKSMLSKGNYDLSGAVTSIAAQGTGGNTASFLVAATGSRLPTKGAPTVVTNGRYLVSVQLVAGSWLATAVTPVG